MFWVGEFDLAVIVSRVGLWARWIECLNVLMDCNNHKKVYHRMRYSLSLEVRGRLWVIHGDGKVAVRIAH